MEIQVVLRNTSPIFSAAPGAATISLDGTYNPARGGFPFVRTRRMFVVTDNVDDGGNSTKSIPVVPSNTMRNLLRRMALETVIIPALKDKSAQVSIGAYAAMMTGSQSGNPDGVASSFDETVTMRQNLFIGLMGGGPRMLRGRLSVENLYPIHQDALRVIGENFIDTAVSGSITQPVWLRRIDPITQLKDKEDVAVIVDGLEKANEWITALQEAKPKKGKAQTDDETGDKSARGLNAFNAHEVVIPGIDWVWNIRLDNPTDAQVGLVLMALSKLNNYHIAGGFGKGYGCVDLTTISLNSDIVWVNGSMNDSISKYVDAMAQELDELDVAQIETFAASAK